MKLSTFMKITRINYPLFLELVTFTRLSATGASVDKLDKAFPLMTKLAEKEGTTLKEAFDKSMK